MMNMLVRSPQHAKLGQIAEMIGDKTRYARRDQLADVQELLQTYPLLAEKLAHLPYQSLRQALKQSQIEEHKNGSVIYSSQTGPKFSYIVLFGAIKLISAPQTAHEGSSNDQARATSESKIELSKCRRGGVNANLKGQAKGA